MNKCMSTPSHIEWIAPKGRWWTEIHPNWWPKGQHPQWWQGNWYTETHPNGQQKGQHPQWWQGNWWTRTHPNGQWKGQHPQWWQGNWWTHPFCICSQSRKKEWAVQCWWSKFRRMVFNALYTVRILFHGLFGTTTVLEMIAYSLMRLITQLPLPVSHEMRFRAGGKNLGKWSSMLCTQSE